MKNIMNLLLLIISWGLNFYDYECIIRSYVTFTQELYFLWQGFKSGSVRNFVMSVESPLGPLLYLRVWHDNSGIKDKASWYLNMINVMDLQTGEK